MVLLIRYTSLSRGRGYFKLLEISVLVLEMLYFEDGKTGILLKSCFSSADYITHSLYTYKFGSKFPTKEGSPS